MSFICDLCQTILSTKQHLEDHKYKRKIPCNLQCKICKEVCVSTKDYKVHILTHTQQNSQSQELAIVSEPKNAKKVDNNNERRLIVKDEHFTLPIPVQDFNAYVLKQYNLEHMEGLINNIKIKGVERSINEHKDENTDTDLKEAAHVNADGDIEIDRTTTMLTVIKVEKHEKIILRTMDARKALTNDMMARTMLGLNPEQGINQLNLIATSMIYDVLHHGDTRLHNICLSDMSRGTVRVFSRKPITDQCCWIAHSKDIAPTVIKEYARDLFGFMLEAGMHSLVSAIYKPEKKSCLALNDSTNYSVILMQDSFNSKKLKAVHIPSEHLVYSPTKDVEHIMQLVQTRKDEVILQLEDLIIQNSDLQKCLGEGRKFCYVTMQQTMNLPIQKITDVD